MAQRARLALSYIGYRASDTLSRGRARKRIKRRIDAPMTGWLAGWLVGYDDEKGSDDRGREYRRCSRRIVSC